MQGLLIDHLVEHKDPNGVYFTLTCTICGEIWKSDARPDMTRTAAAEEAAKQIRMCPFCGRPVCGNCFTNVEGITLCSQCGQRLQERIEVYCPANP